MLFLSFFAPPDLQCIYLGGKNRGKLARGQETQRKQRASSETALNMPFLDEAISCKRRHFGSACCAVLVCQTLTASERKTSSQLLRKTTKGKTFQLCPALQQLSNNTTGLNSKYAPSHFSSRHLKQLLVRQILDSFCYLVITFDTLATGGFYSIVIGWNYSPL